MADFIVVDYLMTYDTVLRRSSLRELRASTTIQHLAMKLLTPERVGVLWASNKKLANVTTSQSQLLGKRLRRPRYVSNRLWVHGRIN
ncbi:hypothetical protein PanWU01x14_283630 [Parasponia andersonii]|uniref:Uncharacterized protein n=1 Tax=Parasponia andersonii TaxID=3476 RepID=A0A2P5B0A7_PARAD|nr:hypothetical protein PanWU01x14_283630 [Parasponia andersonii]